LTDFPILSLMLALPLVGAAMCLFANAAGARWIAFGATLLTFALGVALWVGYDLAGPQWQFTENVPLFGRFAYALGIDGIALMLIMLTVFLMPICIAASWKSVERRVPEYMAAFLLMETLMIGVFAAQDLLLFYIFFEAGLIPMYLIIGIWGGDRRIYASYKFFLYTLLGSIVMLVAMLWMAREAGTTSIPVLMNFNFDRRRRRCCGWRSSPRSRSRCRCGRCIPGCPMRTSRRRPRVR
jgi:NADH-quinone oxidoreductase subunit M